MPRSYCTDEPSVRISIFMEFFPQYWLAGILEGEGTFMSGPPSQPNSPVARICMTDRDVVARAALLLERAVTPVSARQAHYKPPYVTQVKGHDAVGLMRAMRMVLGPDRQQQIDRVLKSWAPRRIRRLGALNRFTPLDAFKFVANDDRAISWLAGLLEGEGTFTMTCDARFRCYPVVELTMCDAAVVFRAARILGRSTVRMREPERPDWRPTYVAKVGGADAAVWMRTLREVMGERRRTAIDVSLARYHPVNLVDPPDSCVVPGCSEPHRGRGLCHKHYMMWSRDQKNGRAARIAPLR
jgi:hypothetical protein